MGLAAYNTSIKKGGTPTTMTSEAMGGSGTTFQITNTAKRVVDRNFAYTIYDNGVAVDVADIASFDMMFGKVIFTGSKTGPITITGKYIPLAEVDNAISHGVDITGDVLDDTDFATAAGNGGYRTKKYGLNDVKVTMARNDDLSKDFKDLVLAGTPVVLDITPANQSEKIRGWFVPESVSSSGDVAALEQESLSFTLDGDTTTSFSWV